MCTSRGCALACTHTHAMFVQASTHCHILNPMCNQTYTPKQAELYTQNPCTIRNALTYKCAHIQEPTITYTPSYIHKYIHTTHTKCTHPLTQQHTRAHACACTHRSTQGQASKPACSNSGISHPRRQTPDLRAKFTFASAAADVK